jgi:uncharacterized protein
MENKLIKLITKSIQKLSEGEPDILAVYLLGSILQGSMRPDSDIDLGIMLEPGSNISSLTKEKLAGILSYKMGRTVDIGEVSNKNLVYAREAFLKGRLVYTKNKTRTNLYRANLLGMYLQYNLDRQEVVNAYKTR